MPVACEGWPWKRAVLPAMFMPRSFSRLTLDITGVRAERVQDISDADAIAEGCYRGLPTADGGVSWRAEFAALWDGLYAGTDKAWSINPWVWVVEFRRVEGGGE
jgi:hypothetical protein